MPERHRHHLEIILVRREDQPVPHAIPRPWIDPDYEW